MTLGETLEANSPLAERAKALLPLLDKWATFSDEQGQLAPEIVDAFHEAGLFKTWVPEELGGSELKPTLALEVLALTAYGDASAGWVQMAGSLSVGVAGCYLGDSAVAELFGEGKTTMVAGQGTRPGTATTTEGGYILSGEWGFASGLKHGNYIHTLGIIEETGEPRIFVVPVEKATLVDNWDVMGLRGTGSIDYSLDKVFVPEDYCHFAFTREPNHGGDIYKLGIIGFAEICHSGWAIGVGRRLLDELSGLAQAKTGRAGAQVDTTSFLQQYAEIEGKFRAAGAFVREVWSDIEETIFAGNDVSVRQDTLMRLALGQITTVLLDVANFVYLAGGTTALRRGTIERLVRDVHAGTQHITSAPPMWQACGKELAGLAEGKSWILLDLVEDE